MNGYFEFIGNVPENARRFVYKQVAEWVDRNDSPVVGIELEGVGEVDFCRRPWPPSDSIITTVGAERGADERKLCRFVRSKGLAPKPYDKYKTGAFHWAAIRNNGFYRSRVEPVLARIQSKQRVVDLGCGDGAYMGAVAERCEYVVGAEIEKIAVKLAEVKLGQEGIKNARPLWCDVGDVERRKEFEKEGFDLVYSMDVIEHLSDPHSLLRAAVYCAKQEATIIIGTPLFRGEENISPYHVKEYSEEELLEILSKYITIDEIVKLPEWLQNGTVSLDRYAIVVGRKK